MKILCVDRNRLARNDVTPGHGSREAKTAAPPTTRFPGEGYTIAEECEEETMLRATIEDCVPEYRY